MNKTESVTSKKKNNNKIMEKGGTKSEQWLPAD